MRIIAGLDVSRNFADIAILSCFPDISPLQFFREHQEKICFSLSCDRSGIERLKSLSVAEIILEPTGYWYSGFWVNAARSLGIKINWVSHQEVKHHRHHYGFKNKDDRSDAFTMALMYFDPGARDELGNPRFIPHYECDRVERVRRLWHEREQLDKNMGNNIRQLRQRLLIEHPEIAQKKFNYIGKHGVNPTLGHIARTIDHHRIGETVGTGITPYSTSQAKDIIELRNRRDRCETELEAILSEFPDYDSTFKAFGFGIVLRALLLMHCYPIERFYVAGAPYWRDGHDISLRRFQAFLGLSFTYEKSGASSATGKKIKRKWHGSETVRSHLYAHALIVICAKTIPPRSSTIVALRAAWHHERVDPTTGKSYPPFKALGKDGICRLLFYEARLLYQALKKL